MPGAATLSASDGSSALLYRRFFKPVAVASVVVSVPSPRQPATAIATAIISGRFGPTQAQYSDIPGANMPVEALWPLWGDGAEGLAKPWDESPRGFKSHSLRQLFDDDPDAKKAALT